MQDLLGMQISPQVLAAAIGAMLASFFGIIVGYINNKYDIEKERRRYKREKVLELLVMIQRTNRLHMDRLSNIIRDGLAKSVTEYNAKDFIIKYNAESLPDSSDSASYVALFFPRLTTLYQEIEYIWTDTNNMYHDIFSKIIESFHPDVSDDEMCCANNDFLENLDSITEYMTKTSGRSRALINKLSKELSSELKKI